MFPVLTSYGVKQNTKSENGCKRRASYHFLAVEKMSKNAETVVHFSS